MVHWAFRELVGAESVGVITSWLKTVQPLKRQKKVRQTLSARLIGMEPLNQAQWPDSWTTRLAGYQKILELRFEVWNVQYRPLFFFGLERSTLTFVFPALEVSDDFVPRDAPDRAEALRQDILARRRETSVLDVESIATAIEDFQG